MRHIYIIIFILISVCIDAQLQTTHWYFGEKAGVDFITGNATADFLGNTDTTEGTASISDKCGNLLFYTDGLRVYTRTQIMQNGIGLLGDDRASSTQSAIIIPNPVDSNIYYIFTVDGVDQFIESRGMYYHIVDMSLNNGNGVVTQKNIPYPINGVQKSSEKLTAYKKPDGSGYWVVTHFEDSYYAIEVTGQGVNPIPVVSKIGIHINMSDYDSPTVGEGGRGVLKISHDGTKIAAAHNLQLQRNGALAVYNFDNATGIVSNEIFSIPYADKSFYGLEFSPDNSLLYTTYNSRYVSQGQFLHRSRIVQFDLNAASILNSEYILDEISSSSEGMLAYYGMQLGLDDKIYIVRHYRPHLGVINNPNQVFDPNTGANPDFVQEGLLIQFGAELPRMRCGLPNFVSSFLSERIYFNGKFLVNGNEEGETKYCVNHELTFTPDICGLTIQDYAWDFGDGNTSTLANPNHTYTNIGIYTVTLTVTAPGGQSNTFTIQIEIVPPPDVQNAELKECPDLNGDEIIFDLTQSYVLINPNNEIVDLSFHLTELEAEQNENEQSLNFSTSTTTILWVRAENEWGCITVVQLELNFHELPEFTIEFPEVEICTNSSEELEIITDATNTVNWYSNQTDTTPIFTGNPFTTPNLTTTTSYWVEVISDQNCPSERQEITVEVLDEITPQFNQIAPICFGEEFELPNESINEITGTWTPAIDNTQTTTYTFEPAAGQCSAQNVTMTVEVIPTPEITLPSPIEICSGETVSITISTTGETLNWYENELDTTPIFSGLNFSEELTETTTFWLEAQTGSCLSERVSFTITVNPLPTIQAEISNPICEGNPAELSVITNGNIINWYTSETAATPIFTGNPFTTPNLSETTIYWAEASSSENCTSQRIPVTATVSEEITPEFNFDLEYCLNSPEIILPTTDENGITGNWFPDTISTNNLGTTIYTFEPDLECAEPIFRTITIVEIIAPEFDDLLQNYCLGVDAETLPTLSDNGISGTWFPTQIDTNIQCTTNYVFTPNDNQCSEPYQHTITVFPHPDMDLEEELLICQGDSFDYSAPDGFDSYTWKNEQDQIISTTQEVTFTEEGIYTLTVEINGIPCPLIRDLEVKFSTPPTITEIKTTENTITVYATGGNPLEYSMNQVFWQSSPTFTNLQPGVFNVFVRDVKGCSTTAKQTGILGVPNFISPNGDGYNDIWELRGLEVYPNTKLQIFDRNGKIFVDRMIDSNFTWDGKYNSQPLPSGAYWYILILESGEKISGHINIRNY